MSDDAQQPKESTNSNELNRRAFIKTAGLAAGAAAATASCVSNAQTTGIAKNILPATVLGANEKILTGHIGLGQMGKRDLFLSLQREEIQPIAMCDIFEQHREQGADITLNNYPNNRPTTHQYHEEIIDNKDIDAVVIVTPDHWHSIPTIMACEAGKDVWCEKPLTTSLLEGQPIIDAVRKNKRVLQCGNFQRSGEHFQDVVNMVQSGYIGQVARVETWIHDSMKKEGIGNPRDRNRPPRGIDWDRYLGWTKTVPFNQNRYLYNFRWFLDYSGGKMTDWGAHLIDIVLWAMGEENRPKEVMAMGEKYVLEDNRTTPDTLEVLYRFDNYMLSFSNRVYNGTVERNRYGIKFYGDKGTIYVDRAGYEVIPVNDGCEAKKVEGVVEGTMNEAHWKNWVECLKSREDPICFVESAFNTAETCHIGTAAYVAGGRLNWDAETKRFSGADEEAAKKANDFAYRPYDNGYSLASPWLPSA